MDRNHASELDANIDALKAAIARLDATYDEMAREHAEGRVGDTPILSPTPIVHDIELAGAA